jgi:predicted acylesterase/phospholipase RssA/CRP-like cAMP-binding protein
MKSTVALLRNVPVLSALSDELLERVAADVEELEVSAGEWIFREGEAAKSMFIVSGGSVEIISELPHETLIGVVRRGEVLGELALLREGTRSLSARARRGSRLLELGRNAFERLIMEAPPFALALTRALGVRLAASHAPIAKASPPRLIAVVGLHPGAPTADVAERLRQALGGHGTVALLSSGGVGEIDQAERDVDRVILRGGETPDEEWTQFSLREADMVLATASSMPSDGWLRHARLLRGCELLVLAPRAPTGLLASVEPRQVQVVADASQLRATLASTARRFAGQALGIVFSGGGARALAHLGVVEELIAAGLHFDRVAGVSAGSLVAATIASGFSVKESYELFRLGFVETNPTNDYAPPAFSIIRGAKTRRLLRAAFGDRRIEELPLRFFSVSCDLVSHQPVVHAAGPLADAVYASLAIPGIFPPIATPDGRLLVDGGVLDNLPVATMARSGEGPVIAVDVTGRPGDFGHPGRPRLRKLGGTLRRALTGSDAEIPRLGETIVRAVTVGSVDTVDAARMHADLVITPRPDGVGLMEWKALPRVYESGREAARAVLAEKAEVVGRWLG